MKKLLDRSHKEKHLITLRTKHPDGDAYWGVVLGFSRSVVVLHECEDFEFGNIVVVARKYISEVVHGRVEACAERIVRRNAQIKKLSKVRWIAELASVRDAIGAIKKRGIWPTVETVHGDDDAYNIGPIVKVGKTTFSQIGYDAKGEWKREYELKYSHVFKIEIFDKYSTYFNQYMSERPFPTFRN